MVSLEQIKKLRQMTKAPIKDCKKILEKTKGNFDQALKLLKQKEKFFAQKKKDRQTKKGMIGLYLHFSGKIGAMVKVTCETDFVAQNDLFKKLAHELAMQVAATSPKDIKELMKQPYIKDESKTIENLVQEVIFKTGENIQIEDFKRMEI